MTGLNIRVPIPNGYRSKRKCSGNEPFPEYTRRERQLDCAVHLVGVGASVIAAIAMLDLVVQTHDFLSVFAATLYCAGLVPTLGLSAAYNLTVHTGWKVTLRKLDHATIFVMIAGTYTPFALIAIGGNLGVALFAMVWIAAVAGFLFKFLWPRRLERLSVFLYLILGWIGLPVVGQLIAALPASALVLLGIGGVFYTVGVVFHLRDAVRYNNVIWHVLVLGGAGCHFFAVLQVLVGR